MFQRVLRTQFNPLHVTQTGTERSGKAFLETIHFESQGELGRVSQKKRQGRGRIFLSEGRVRAEGWVHERATDLVGAECRWGGTTQTYSWPPSLTTCSAPRLLIQNITHSGLQMVQIDYQNSDSADVKKWGTLLCIKHITMTSENRRKQSVLSAPSSKSMTGPGGTQSLHFTESYAHCN